MSAQIRDNLESYRILMEYVALKYTNKQIQKLKGLAHKLEPVVTIGKLGISDALMKQVEDNLTANELIKIKVQTDSREELKNFSNELAHKSDATLVQVIGKIVILFRESKKKRKIQI